MADYSWLSRVGTNVLSPISSELDKRKLLARQDAEEQRAQRGLAIREAAEKRALGEYNRLAEERAAKSDFAKGLSGVANIARIAEDPTGTGGMDALIGKAVTPDVLRGKSDKELEALGSDINRELLDIQEGRAEYRTSDPRKIKENVYNRALATGQYSPAEAASMAANAAAVYGKDTTSTATRDAVLKDRLATIDKETKALGDTYRKALSSKTTDADKASAKKVGKLTNVLTKHKKSITGETLFGDAGNKELPSLVTKLDSENYNPDEIDFILTYATQGENDAWFNADKFIESDAFKEAQKHLDAFKETQKQSDTDKPSIESKVKSLQDKRREDKANVYRAMLGTGAVEDTGEKEYQQGVLRRLGLATPKEAVTAQVEKDKQKEKPGRGIGKPQLTTEERAEILRKDEKIEKPSQKPDELSRLLALQARRGTTTPQSIINRINELQPQKEESLFSKGLDVIRRGLERPATEEKPKAVVRPTTPKNVERIREMSDNEIKALGNEAITEMLGREGITPADRRRLARLRSATKGPARPIQGQKLDRATIDKALSSNNPEAALRMLGIPTADIQQILYP